MINLGQKKRLWTNYFTTANNASEQLFTFATPDDFRVRHLKTVFVGLATPATVLGLYFTGQEFSKVDLSRFAAGDAILEVEYDFMERLQLTVSLQSIVAAALTNVPITIGYYVDPNTGP